MFKNHSKHFTASLLGLSLGVLSTAAFSAASVTYLNYNVVTGQLTTTINGTNCIVAGNSNTETLNSKLDIFTSTLINAKTSGASIYTSCGGTIQW